MATAGAGGAVSKSRVTHDDLSSGSHSVAPFSEFGVKGKQINLPDPVINPDNSNPVEDYDEKIPDEYEDFLAKLKSQRKETEETLKENVKNENQEMDFFEALSKQFKDRNDFIEKCLSNIKQKKKCEEDKLRKYPDAKDSLKKKLVEMDIENLDIFKKFVKKERDWEEEYKHEALTKLMKRHGHNRIIPDGPSTSQ